MIESSRSISRSIKFYAGHREFRSNLVLTRLPASTRKFPPVFDGESLTPLVSSAAKELPRQRGGEKNALCQSWEPYGPGKICGQDFVARGARGLPGENFSS